MERTLKNAIAKAKREMDKYMGRTGLLDIAYGIEWEYHLRPEETEVLIQKMRDYNEKECCGLFR